MLEEALASLEIPKGKFYGTCVSVGGKTWRNLHGSKVSAHCCEFRGWHAEFTKPRRGRGSCYVKSSPDESPRNSRDPRNSARAPRRAREGRDGLSLRGIFRGSRETARTPRRHILCRVRRSVRGISSRSTADRARTAQAQSGASLCVLCILFLV